MILGIDFGSSSIDFVLFDKQKKQTLCSFSFFSDLKNLKKTDLMQFINIEKFPLELISSINVTGCGSRFFSKKFRGIPVKKISEIDAIASGALFFSNCNDFLAVSLGSGTCMVSYKDGKARHVGGSAVGGKTLTGLSKLLLKTNDFLLLEALAGKGKLERIDLMVGDIYPEGIGLLEKNVTAAHFGKISMNPKREDIALALFNLIAQAAAGTAFFAALANKHKKIVFTGKLSESRIIQQIIIERVGVVAKDNEFVFLEQAGIATAIGAALL